jgi:hypothetical protein
VIRMRTQNLEHARGDAHARGHGNHGSGRWGGRPEPAGGGEGRSRGSCATGPEASRGPARGARSRSLRCTIARLWPGRLQMPSRCSSCSRQVSIQRSSMDAATRQRVAYARAPAKVGRFAHDASCIAGWLNVQYSCRAGVFGWFSPVGGPVDETASRVERVLWRLRWHVVRVSDPRPGVRLQAG